MTVGLPGAGIGGLFYLVAALVMPLREGWLALRGRSSRARWVVVLRQFACAGGMMLVMWTTGYLLALGALLAARPAAGRVAGPGGSAQRVAEWLRPTHGWASLVALATLLAVVWIASRVVARPAPPLAEAPGPLPPVTAALPPHVSHAPPAPHAPRLRKRQPTPWRVRAVRQDEG